MSAWARFRAFFIGAVVVLLLAAGAGTTPGEARGGAPSRKVPLVLQVVIDGGITHSTREYFAAALARARHVHAEAVVIQLDTPGGLLEATREMVRDILESQTPVITFVSPQGARAGSAGLFIALASHVAAMAPSTNIGASHPVSSFGGDVEGTMGEKIANDTAAWARSLAETRGRDRDAAEKAVKESASFTAQEAIKNGLVDVGAKDVEDLLRVVNGRSVNVAGTTTVLRTERARIEDFERTPAQALYDWLANPTLLYVLLLAGILGIYIEIQNPGLIVPGALGAVFLGVVFGLQLLPVNTFGALLIGLAAVLLFAEVYVTSFGLLSIAGLACLVIGSYLLFEVEGSTFRLRGSVIWVVAITFTAVLLFIGTLLVRAKRQGPTSGVDTLTGRMATACEPFGSGEIGRVFLDGTYWNARSDNPIAEGDSVRVERIEGLTVVVSRMEPPEVKGPESDG